MEEVKAEALSNCCNSEVYIQTMWPDLIRDLEQTKVLKPHQFRPFTEQNFCKSCERPCEITYSLQS